MALITKNVTITPRIISTGARGYPPMTGTYTKFILTAIAACLAAIVVRQAPPSANAQFGLGCDGSPQAPCYVRLIQ